MRTIVFAVLCTVGGRFLFDREDVSAVLRALSSMSFHVVDMDGERILFLARGEGSLGAYRRHLGRRVGEVFGSLTSRR